MTRARKMDLRLFLADEPCDIAILGDEEELLKIALEHAVNAHGYRDTPQLREDLRALLREERKKMAA